MPRKHMDNIDLTTLVRQFVDYLLPELTPYEVTLYIILLRLSLLKDESLQSRIGKRTLAATFARGMRGERPNYDTISGVIKGLEQRGCIKVGDTNREGTLYTVVLPERVPIVIERLSVKPAPQEENYFTDPKKRLELFERDSWVCHFCGDLVTQENATLDHFIPQSKAGGHSKENLKTCCLLCNSIKSGRTYEEAAPLLLISIRERKRRQSGI